ncbi:Bestrophin, RFP-TM, chloride channel-domain-containing protein [Achaetomium macrosporum]|uniref:Bestrophin, RFP-TM, chloride channel-domain-containing protein n=1 Tax=Achaetomium macrosporum TaxID=79813 RepID=A0AAN7H8P6_9PEZI|nr:Bestrophin, RFP-TM, chloride channel-domain-containing protein [Achaetomium macrosporum]
MADDAGHGAAGAPAAPAAPGAPGVGRGHSDVTLSVNTQAAHAQKVESNVSNNNPQIEEIASLTSPRLFTPNPFSRKNTSLDIDDYFTGPRDIQKHSKWPLFLQMHGSILPKMIVPLLAVAAWASLITSIHMRVTTLQISSVLLTVLGFVVGLGLSFRSSTAYERYAEGRRYWAQLILASHNLGRLFWVHSTEPKDIPEEQLAESRKRDVLEKLTAMNLIVAFAVALKHRLRFEPYTCYDDISSLVSHLNTFALSATEDDKENAQRAFRRHGFFKSVGEYLGISFAESNPRKAVKKAGRPLGNLPLEILSYLASYVDELSLGGRLPIPMQQTTAYNNIAALNDVLVGTERVLNTPLPIAYSIAIAQITWVYIILLPFQLLSTLNNWITIPATVAAAYIILGILFIGREIENPFGQDVNDLPLELYCAQIAAEMDVIASRPKPQSKLWMESPDNRVLWPLSNSGWPVWMTRTEDKIREAVVHKVEQTFLSQSKKEAAAAAKRRPFSEKGHAKPASAGEV